MNHIRGGGVAYAPAAILVWQIFFSIAPVNLILPPPPLNTKKFESTNDKKKPGHTSKQRIQTIITFYAT